MRNAYSDRIVGCLTEAIGLILPCPLPKYFIDFNIYHVCLNYHIIRLRDQVMISIGSTHKYQ
jgi:hypothetical protein